MWEYQYTGDCSFEAMKDFSDTAVVVFSRKGGEGNDLPTSMAENTSYAPDQSKHYLELNSAEQSLLEQAEATFDNVIVLINSGNAMELGFLNDEGVDAALWIGDPGDVGTIGIVNILTGAVNPSGRLPDIYPYAVETTPFLTTTLIPLSILTLRTASKTSRKSSCLPCRVSGRHLCGISLLRNP